MSKFYKKDYIILLLILILGLSLRLYNLGRYSVYFDEKSSLVVSQGLVLDGSNQKEIYLASSFTPKQFWSPKTLADYYEAMSRSDIGNSPFYYLLLHFWLEIFGISDFSARLFSVVFSIMIILAIYLFGRRFFSSKTGLIAAALVAIEPFFISYSHQARNYSLTFFLALMSTYFFLKIIENKDNSRRSLLLYLGYFLAAGLGLLSHFLTIAVLLAHGVYALFFLKTLHGWIKMAVTGLMVISVLAWWLLFAGGQSTLDNLSDQAVLYKAMAETNAQTFGSILPASPKNVFLKSIPVFSDQIIFTNGLTEALQGKKNVILALLIGLFFMIWYRNRLKINGPRVVINAVPYVLLVCGFFYYSNHQLQFSILSVSIFALSFVYDIHVQSSELQRKRLWLLYIMFMVPALFIITMSFKNGHTYALSQHRYSGSSFPYVVIILSLLLQHYISLAPAFRTLVFLFIGIQFCFVGQTLQEFYQDKSVKYNQFAVPRPANPFYAAARKIVRIYQPGDTIVYPAKPNIIMREQDRNFSNFRMRDAQLTTLYLPKNAEYVQRVDTTEQDLMVIRRNGQTLEIVNLKGLRAGDD